LILRTATITQEYRQPEEFGRHRIPTSKAVSWPCHCAGGGDRMDEPRAAIRQPRRNGSHPDARKHCRDHLRLGRDLRGRQVARKRGLIAFRLRGRGRRWRAHLGGRRVRRAGM